MKTKKKIYTTSIFILLFLAFFSQAIYSQDIHFSQFNFCPLNLNPAKTAYFEGQHRFAANHKNQWMSVTIPYMTFSASWDAGIIKRKQKNDILGLGVLAVKDQAGDSKFGTTQINISLSYIKALDNRNKHILSYGIMGGLSQRSIDYSALYFDSQFNGLYYDADLPHNENFGKTSFLYYDISTGVEYNYVQNEYSEFCLGASLWHLNRAKQSLNEDNSVTMDPKLLLYGNFSYLHNIKHYIKPAFYFARQGPHTEFLLGGHYQLILNHSKINYNSFNAGLFYRNKDAAILMAGVDYQAFKINFSYDVNLSKLRPASQFRGGYEFSLIYIIQKQKPSIHKEIPCPIF